MIVERFPLTLLLQDDDAIHPGHDIHRDCGGGLRLLIAGMGTVAGQTPTRPAVEVAAVPWPVAMPVRVTDAPLIDGILQERAWRRRRC